MKHVIVLHSHNFSAEYLSEQRLRNSLAPNFDSTAVFEKPNGFGKDVQVGLQSVDGIQFHHFKHCEPRNDLNQPPSERDIEYWVNKLQSSLPKGETLDAVVIPMGYNTENAANLRWIREMKTQFPSLKVMVEEPDLSYEPPKNAGARYALPLIESAQITAGIRKAIIKADTPNYQLAAGIDVATKNIYGLPLANALREMLGMPLLQEQKKGWGVA